jgi:hypothetical protein
VGASSEDALVLVGDKCRHELPFAHRPL